MTKHIPLRRCVGCREMYPKQTLIKIVKCDGAPVVDAGHKMFGRGTYLCKKAVCIENAAKRKMLQRHMKTSVPDEFYKEIEAYIDG